LVVANPIAAFPFDLVIVANVFIIFLCDAARSR